MDAIVQNLTDVWTLNLLIAACIALPSGIIQRYAGFGRSLFEAPFFTLPDFFGGMHAAVAKLPLLFRDVRRWPGSCPRRPPLPHVHADRENRVLPCGLASNPALSLNRTLDRAGISNRAKKGVSRQFYRTPNRAADRGTRTGGGEST